MNKQKLLALIAVKKAKKKKAKKPAPVVKAPAIETPPQKQEPILDKAEPALIAAPSAPTETLAAQEDIPAAIDADPITDIVFEKPAKYKRTKRYRKQIQVDADA